MASRVVVQTLVGSKIVDRYLRVLMDSASLLHGLTTGTPCSGYCSASGSLSPATSPSPSGTGAGVIGATSPWRPERHPRLTQFSPALRVALGRCANPALIITERGSADAIRGVLEAKR
jgi:hypothetical protein